jgi:hypothetical protein
LQPATGRLTTNDALAYLREVCSVALEAPCEAG